MMWKKVPLTHTLLAYAEKAEAEKDPLKNIFNCTQRAHQVMRVVKKKKDLAN
jgi:hypothetical protein